MNASVPSAAPEFEPLLAPGFHCMTMADLRYLCVGNFSRPAVRDQLMTGLEAVASRLRDSGAHGDLWVNGSFLTKEDQPC